MSFNSSKRKLHKSYMILWNTQISTDGYAKCLIETCNFISGDLHLMQEHYKTCNGVGNHESNLCSSCNKWMPSKAELIVHIAECNGRLKSNSDKQKRHNLEKFEIQGHDEVCCGSEQNKNRMNSPDNQKKDKEVKFCKVCEQVFSCDTEYLQHLIPCQENSKKILSRKNWPKTMKENIDKDDERCIIQPGRDIPKEQYVRRRGFTKQHKAAWETAMRKYRHVKCMFQKCHFLAMSVEDMVSHYGYCNGDGSFAEFVCPYCEGRVTSEEILKIHILRSHTIEIPLDGNNGNVNNSTRISSDSKSWEKSVSSEEAVEFEKDDIQSNLERFCGINNVKNDIKDVNKPNEQIPKDNPPENSSDDVKNSNETNEEFSAHPKRKIQNYDSGVKKKKCLNEVNETIHESESNETQVTGNEGDHQSNKTYDLENNGDHVKQMIKFSFPSTPNPPRRDVRPSYTSAWKESIKKNGFARCLVATCNFISLDVFHIENHYKTCNGTPEEGPNSCSFCRSRLPSSIELWIHESVCRGNNEITSINASECQKLIFKEIEDSKSSGEMENLSPKVGGENQNGVNSEAGDTNKGNEISLNENETPLKEGRNSLRISDIMKTLHDEAVGDKPIVQSRPDLPPGAHYVRRRPYTKTHKASWETALKKHKYVKCMFQNCNFLAVSLEDMIYHFGYCSGDGSFAKFECPYCKGRLTTESILDVHIQISHPDGNGDGSTGNDRQGEEFLPSLDELKKLVATKEIKTYGRPSRKSKLDKSVNSMKETGNGCSTAVVSENDLEEARAETEIGANNIVPFDPDDENLKISNTENVLSASENDENQMKTCKNNIISPESREESSQETYHKTAHRKRKFTSPDKTFVTQSELNEVDHVKPVNSCEGNGRKGRKTRASRKSNEQDESSENLLENKKEMRDAENESTEMEGKPEVNVSEVPNEGKVKAESFAEPEQTPRKTGKRGRPRANVSKKDSEQTPTPAKRGRPGKKVEDKSSEESENQGAETVKCSQCDLTTTRDLFIKHNYKTHGGLSWIVGENAIDLSDEKEVEKIVKTAFKYTKSAECHNCHAVKKSALGFISHIKNCGKSKEEKEALKVTCPYCPARLLSYSLPMHLKLSHSGADSGKTENVANENVQQLPSKRKSAIRAVNKCNEVLKEYFDDEEDSKKKIDFVLFEKGISKCPKVPRAITAAWKKALKNKKRIKCQRKGCNVESCNVQEARNHYFKCLYLPEKCYLCLICNFYSETENIIQEHVGSHSVAGKDFIPGSEDERTEEQEPTDNEPDEEDHKLKTGEGLSDENALETMYKTKFFIREKIHNERQTRFCCRSLRMTLDSELEDLKENTPDWSEFHTKLTDWIKVSLEESLENLPSLQESISFKVNFNGKTDKANFEKLARFSGRIIDDTTAFFTGGSILSMSWCKYSCVRSSSQIQYLAVSSSRNMNKYQNIHEECNEWSGLVQIWSCGEMLTNLQQVPKMVIGIVHDSGEVWDLSWFPADCYDECKNKNFLRRIGLLGGACRDGTVRIWSICDPEQLKNKTSVPLYKIKPAVILELEGEKNVGCMRLAIGRTGIVVGGYANGMVAAWNLNSISSPFSKRSGNSYVLKPYSSFQAHRTSITALSICPNSDRYITTSGLDRYIKFWDLECSGVPFECMQKEVCLENVWPMHWPATISLFENIVLGAGKGMIKAIRNAYCDKHTAPLSLDGTCWGLSFNNWLNLLCGCNSIGDVKIRYVRNMFLTDEKFKLKAGNLFSTTEVKLLGQEEKKEEEGDGKKKEKKKKVNEYSIGPRTYEEASQFFGLVFNDHKIDYEKVKSAQTGKKGSQSMEDYPIASANKVCWNPNYTSFMHLAIGYQCGLVRIKTLNDAKCLQEVSEFFSEANEKIPKVFP